MIALHVSLTATVQYSGRFSGRLSCTHTLSVCMHHCLTQVEVFNRPPRERVPYDLSWVDSSVDAEVQRVNVKMDPLFLANLLVCTYINYMPTWILA